MIVISALLLSMSWSAQPQPQADFYVATDGNDNWSGKFATPNPTRTDGPFATVARAERAVRTLKASKAVTVFIRGGIYFLTQPLVFTDQDSGSAERPVTYASFPGESPVFSGGVRLKGWHYDKSGHWQTTIPEVAKGEWYFSQLFVNGQRRFRPRLPHHGYYHIAQKARTVPAKDHGPDRFVYAPGEIKPEWKDLDVDILAFHTSSMSRLHIASVDDKEHLVTFTGPTFREYHDLRKGDRFIVENVPEVLDQPGLWYLDRKIGVVSYVPQKNEQMETADVIAPRLDRILDINGTQHVRFIGLSFEHSNWNAPREGYSFAQGDVTLPAAVMIHRGRHLDFTRCRVQHTGAYGLEMGAGSKLNHIEHSEFFDLGAGGIKIGDVSAAMARNEDAEPNRNEDFVPSNNVVRENQIEGGGRVQPGGIGIWIGHSPFNEILHNRVSDFYYTGISVGWVWGFRPSLAQHNRIEDNHVLRIGQGVLSDLGGIYTLGVSTGTVIRHNLVHDVQAFASAGRGLYLDDGSSGILVENNIVYGNSHEAFMLSFGRDNEVINNIFALSKNELIGLYKKSDGLSVDFERNILYWTQGKLLEAWDGDNRVMHNLVWTPGVQVPQFGSDEVTADPLFTNPDAGDFRLKDGSPAVQIGFKPITSEGVGLGHPPRHVAIEKAY